MVLPVERYLSGTGLGAEIVRMVISSALVRAAGMFFSFLVGVQLARALGLEGYGVYGLAMSIIAILTVFTEFGMPQLVTREIAIGQAANDWAPIRGVIRWATTMTLAITVLIWLGFSAWLFSRAGLGSSDLYVLLVAGMLLIPISALGNLYGAALRGLQKVVSAQVSVELLRPALLSLFIAFVAIASISLEPLEAMVLGLVSAALSTAVALVLVRREIPLKATGTSPRTRDRHWWVSAFPMALTEAMRVLQGHIAVLIIGWMLNVAEVGLFKIALSVFLLITFPIALLNVVGAPVIARLHAQGDRGREQRLLSGIAGSMTFGVVLLSVPFYIFGESIIAFLFGEAFVQANSLLLVLSISAIVNGIFGANAALLNMTGHQMKVTKASAIALASLLLTLPVLVRYFDTMGAAIGSVFAMSLWNLTMWYDARQILSLDTSIISALKPRSTDV